MKIFEIYFDDLCDDSKLEFMEFHNVEFETDLPLGPILHLEMENNEEENE